MVRANELASSDQDRADRGAWYTPRPVAEVVTEKAFGAEVPSFVVDPTCGGGAFLLAALDAFVARGVDPAGAVRRVAGLDVDANAVSTADEVVRCWAENHGVVGVDPLVRVGDALDEWPSNWPAVELVLGNPPFASPLRSTKARSSHDLPLAAVAFREEHRELLGPYADLAAIHLLSAARRVDPHRGRLAMVLPHSMLASRDVTHLQQWCARELPIEDLWISSDRHFDANVRVFAPVLSRSASPPRDDRSSSWAEAAATAMGVPNPRLPVQGPRLASMCSATAGFRDEYYAMAGACVEGVVDDERCRLATVGAIDPLEHSWGRVPTRFAKSKWDRPVVDDRLVPEASRSWFERQRAPKVLLATQARILEPFVDRAGTVIPITPLVSISAAPAELDRVAAVLLAPAVAAWAARRSFGSALSVNAIKLRAADVLDIPLPVDERAWGDAAGLVGEGPGAVDRIAERMSEAYASGDEILAWWRQRRS